MFDSTAKIRGLPSRPGNPIYALVFCLKNQDKVFGVFRQSKLTVVETHIQDMSDIPL
jgi:hypothetical protein